MPAVGEQIALPGSRTNPDLVAARFLLNPGRRIESCSARGCIWARSTNPNNWPGPNPSRCFTSKSRTGRRPRRLISRKRCGGGGGDGPVALAGGEVNPPTTVGGLLTGAASVAGAGVNGRGGKFEHRAADLVDTAGLQVVGRQLFGIQDTPKGNGGPEPAPAPAAPAALPAPEPPAKPTEAPPAPKAEEPPRPGSLTESDLLGTETERREQAEIRAAPFRRPLNRRRNAFL
jgi:hypothetical protein